MKFFLKLAFLFPLIIYSQVGLITDKDGYVNVRNSHEYKNSKIIDTFQNNHLVWIYNQINEWYEISDIKNENRNGFIHKSRVHTFEDLGLIPVIEKGNNHIILENKYINIRIERAQFNPENHILKKNKTNKPNEYEYIELIDNIEVWGTDGELPKKEYSKFEININGNKFEINKEKYLKNLFEPKFYSLKSYYDNELNKLYISSINSDGAGAYLVLFIIENENSIEKHTLIPF